MQQVLSLAGPCEDPAAVQPCAAATPVPQALIENMLAALDEHQEAPGQLLLPEGWQAPAALAAPLGAARLTAAQPLSASGQLLSDPQRQACLRGSQQPPHTTTLHQAQFCGIIPKDSHRCLHADCLGLPGTSSVAGPAPQIRLRALCMGMQLCGRSLCLSACSSCMGGP